MRISIEFGHRLVRGRELARNECPTFGLFRCVAKSGVQQRRTPTCTPPYADGVPGRVSISAAPWAPRGVPLRPTLLMRQQVGTQKLVRARQSQLSSKRSDARPTISWVSSQS